MLSRLVGEDQRERVFGIQFMLLNLGIGVGGLIAGFVVNVHRPLTFSRLYLADALTFVVYSAVLASVRGHGGPVREPDGDGADARTGRGGYAQVLRDRAMVRLVVVSLVLLASGYGALDVGYPVFSTQILDQAARVVAFGFVGNTAVIVIGQMLAIRFVAGRSRSRLVGLVGIIWASSWLLIGLAAGVHSAQARIVLVLLSPAVFAVGETIFQPVVPALANDLAPEHLRGRYNAMASVTWNLAGMIGPALAGILLGGGRPGLWVAAVTGGCLLGAAGTIWLGRALTAAQDGRAQAQVTVAVGD